MRKEDERRDKSESSLPLRSGALYVDEGDESKVALELLEQKGVRVGMCPIASAGQPLIAPTFVTYEGFFQGVEAIRAYIGWFVDDPLYRERFLGGTHGS